MLRAIFIFLKACLIIAVVGVLASALGVAVARASLPNSSCRVTEAAVDRLELEKMSHADVVSALGCDGVHTTVLAADQFLIEDVSWQGDAWPYAVFTGHFINGVLHGKDVRWVKLNLAFNPVAPRL